MDRQAIGAKMLEEIQHQVNGLGDLTEAHDYEKLLKQASEIPTQSTDDKHDEVDKYNLYIFALDGCKYSERGIAKLTSIALCDGRVELFVIGISDSEREVFLGKWMEFCENAEKKWPAYGKFLSQQKTFPIIFIGGEFVGGCSDLMDLVEN